MWTPASILIKVDLPAPLPPSKASTSWLKSSKVTLFTAMVPPNCLTTFSNRKRGEPLGDGLRTAGVAAGPKFMG